MLEHHGDAVGRARRPACRAPGAAGAEIGQAGDAAQERGLAAAARADDAQDLIAPDLERQLTERHHRAVEEQLACSFRDDGRLVGCLA